MSVLVCGWYLLSGGIVAAQTPQVVLTVNNGPDDIVAEGTSVTLDWWSSGVSDCTLTDVGSVNENGSTAVVVSDVAAKTYTIECGGVSDSVTVYLTPNITIAASEDAVTRGGDGSVDVAVEFTAEYATNCGPLVIEYPNGFSGLLAGSGSLQDAGTIEVPSEHLIENGDYAFRLTCTNESTGVAYTEWSDPVTVTGAVSYTPPACPFIAEGDDIVISFATDAKLFAYQPYDLERAATAIEPISIEPGSYDVRMLTWDGYPNRPTVSQPNERARIAFVSTLNPATLFEGKVTESGSTADLTDGVSQATENMWVNRTAEGSPLVVSQEDADAIVGVRAEHADGDVYTGAGDQSSGSLTPICALLVRTSDDGELVDPETVSVDIAPHIPSFGLNTMSAWVPDAYAGTWDNVLLRDRISNLSSVDIATVVSSIEYDFAVDFDNRLPAYSATETTGSYNGGIPPATQSPSQSTVFDGVPFGDHIFSIALDPDGKIPNENSANNTFERTISIPVPRPPMELTAEPSLVQIGDTVEIGYTVNVGYELHCALFGPGITGTIFSTASGPVVDETRTSGVLENTVTFALQCTEPITNTSFIEIAVVEVVPEFQEI